MEYSIKIQELIDRPIIRDDQMNEWLNKMTDNETVDYFNEMDQMLDEEGVTHHYPDRNSAQLAKLIDRDIIYRLFKDANLMRSDAEIDRKNLWLGLTRLDLQRNRKDLPFDEVGIFDFKASSMSRDQMNKSDIIVFQDDDTKMKYLKDKYAARPLNK